MSVMRWGLLLLLLLPLTVESRGKQRPIGAAWKQKRVPVYDYTPDEWKPVVAQVVADFNAVMPKRAPELVYTPMGGLDCAALPTYGGAGRITVCLGERNEGLRSGLGRAIDRALVSVHAGAAIEARRHLLCHEFMHVVTGIPDVESSTRSRHDAESCVWGNVLDTPGPRDVAFAKRAYARKHR